MALFGASASRAPLSSAQLPRRRHRTARFSLPTVKVAEVFFLFFFQRICIFTTQEVSKKSEFLINERVPREAIQKQSVWPGSQKTISTPTLLNPRWPNDTMRTLTLSLPLLIPIALCDSRQDDDGVNCVPTRPLNQKRKSARKREKSNRPRSRRLSRGASLPPTPDSWADSKKTLFWTVRSWCLMLAPGRWPRTEPLAACARSSHGGRRF